MSIAMSVFSQTYIAAVPAVSKHSNETWLLLEITFERYYYILIIKLMIIISSLVSMLDKITQRGTITVAFFGSV